MTYVLLTKPECEWCTKAKELLRKHGEEFVEFNIIEHPILREFLIANKLKTVPQIFINGYLIGGYQDLKEEVYMFSDEEAEVDDTPH